MGEVVELCPECQGHNLEWQKDVGWVTGSWKHLRCRRCGNSIKLHVPAWTIALYVAATVVAVAAWFAVGRPSLG